MLLVLAFFASCARVAAIKLSWANSWTRRNQGMLLSVLSPERKSFPESSASSCTNTRCSAEELRPGRTTGYMKVSHQVTLLLALAQKPRQSCSSHPRPPPLTSSFSSHTRLGYRLSTHSPQACLYLPSSSFTGTAVLAGNQVGPHPILPFR